MAANRQLSGSPGGYELLDFGSGRKLERFGDQILDRPSPAATAYHCDTPELWKQATLRFELGDGHRGDWWIAVESASSKWATVPKERPFHGQRFRLWDQKRPPQWVCDLSFGTFQCKGTDFGHVGLFPEHFRWWEELSEQVGRSAALPNVGAAFSVLSLFAYTGGSSIAMARAGAQVTHVEAAKNVVQWARENARLSGMAAAPIRWLCEDVQVYVRREVKRGSTYRGLILDPPTYGHGPKGQVWKIQRDLPGLLEQLAEISSPDLEFVLLSAHSEDFDARQLRQLFETHFLGRRGSTSGRLSSINNQLQCEDPATNPRTSAGLDAGVRLLWLAKKN